MQALAAVADAVARLHAAGYAHRDLKPSNVLRLPREGRWTVIDFGCAALLGDTAPHGFTLPYAAPEVVRAWLDGAPMSPVAQGIDSWALGVVAVQLLAGEAVFTPGSSPGSVRAPCAHCMLPCMNSAAILRHCHSIVRRI